MPTTTKKLTENTRTATRARIKRGSALARMQMNRFDRETLEQLDQIYSRAIDELQATIRSYAGIDGNLRLDTLNQLLNQSQQRLGELNAARDALLSNSLGTAASVGVSPFVGEFSDGVLSRIADEAVQFTNNFIGADGLQLSDRIWRVNNHATEMVGNAINNAVIQGHSASQAANDFLRRGEAVPADVAAKMNMANADGVAKRLGRDLMASGSPRANAMRLFRTEINRAHGEAYMMTGEDHPEFAGWKFLLSPRHPEADICDMHARANIHGLGPGVYPSRKRCPWPAHPNTLSYTDIVFIDEVTAEDKAGKESRLDWLKKQPPGVQESVLNSRKKRAALQSGILRENEIATPWNVLKKKYQRKGINVDDLQVVPGTSNVIEPGLGRLVPVGAPVSDALQAVGYKKVTANVLDTIDRIHGDGRLPVIPVHRTASRKYYGAYRSIRYTNRAVDIRIAQIGDHKDFTLAHEIGHFIDQQGLPGNGFSSVNSAALAGWRKAVSESAAINQLKKVVAGPLSVEVDGITYSVQKDYARYLLKTEEIWARSYSQYIAAKSENTLLRSQLSTLVDQSNHAIIDYATQWTSADFAPISDAIDKLFIEMGWLNGQ
ncbi:MAG: hypothetical protein OQK32_03440 [Gammaproteobacteria bacterium]|nr:hypothetical protein [Gammaproteobacteria bacterium]MCW8924508.1 hypothetical protein [Gammaproteobacteria bacterium]